MAARRFTRLECPPDFVVERKRGAFRREAEEAEEARSALLRYIMAWATSDGIIRFRRNIYERDRAGADASFY